MDFPKEGKRILMIRHRGEPLIGMLVRDKIHAYTFNADGEIRFYSFDNFQKMTDKWSYISDLEKVGHLWHV